MPPARASLSRFSRFQAIRPRDRPSIAFVGGGGHRERIDGAVSAVVSCNGAVIVGEPLSAGGGRPRPPL